MDESTFDISARFNRRRALALGGGAAVGVLAAGSTPAAAARPLRKRGKLPAKKIQDALGIEGSVSDGILSLSVDRDDIGHVTGSQGVVFPSSFQLHGDVVFQPLGTDLAFVNGDLALKPDELNPVIDALLKNGLVFQAMHQHFFDLDPMVWFIHFRGTGHPVKLAQAIRRVLGATSTPLPQSMPSNPTTPFSGKRLETILHGTGEVGGDGVITITTARRHTVRIGGVIVEPDVNISTNVEFLPLDANGTRAAVAPDFSMTAAEVGPVMRTMRGHGFEVGCLYNQETGESPQLYFAHMFAVGDPYELAHQVRQGLNHTRAE